jgi:pimeloyl-ACP methyl ester carboxylesterase
VKTSHKHFPGDLPKIDVPTLVVHGTDDRILRPEPPMFIGGQTDLP